MYTSDQKHAPRAMVLCSIAVVILLTGCTSGRELTGFRQFSEAGAKYADSIDALLAETGKVVVDTDSREILDDRDLAPVDETSLEERDNVLREYLLAVVEAARALTEEGFER